MALAAGAHAQAFGRFGYVDQLQMQGFTLDRNGFKADSATALPLTFRAPSRTWRPLKVNEYGETVFLDSNAEAPTKLVADLFAFGVGLYCETGLELNVASKESPFLTWDQGSVDQGVPTPKVSWLLVSFREDQPPVAIVFGTNKVAMQVDGRPGRWTIHTVDPYQGWLRIGLPFGPQGIVTTDAATLGRLVQRFQPRLGLWLNPAPKLQKVEFKSDLQSVTATWQFDHSGAILPFPAFTAPLGGYPLKVESAFDQTDAETSEGPILVSKDDHITIRFPTARIPTGRPVTVGPTAAPSAANSGPSKIPDIVDLAFAVLADDRSPDSLALAQGALQTYLQSVHFQPETWTQQQLPYPPSGQGIDLVAAEALLMQAITSSVQATSQENSLLTSVCWRRDWATWRLWCPGSPAQADADRRASALAALATTLCPEPDRRFQGAMLAAGLAAERGRDLWQKRLGLAQPDPPLLNVMPDLMATMFDFNDQKAKAQGEALLSQVRVFGDRPITASQDSDGVHLDFDSLDAKPLEFMLAAAYPIECSRGNNVSALDVTQNLGYTHLKITPADVGHCQVIVKLPAWAHALPPTPPPIHYQETRS